MSLTIDESQTQATQRQDLRGVIYALSGTILSRVTGVPDAEVRWSTRNILPENGPLGPTDGQNWEPYILLPAFLEDELGNGRGQPPALRPYPMSVRNLAFQHKESILAALVDDDYTWEGSNASLWVTYLKPGQEPTDLVSGDWTPLRLRGILGAPSDMRQDAVTLPLFNRDLRRRDKLNLRRATREDFPNIFPDDEGRIIPVVVGKPDTRARTLRTDAGIFGRAAEALTVDDARQTIEVERGSFTDDQWQTAVLGGATFVLHDSDVELVFDGIDLGTGAGTADGNVTLKVNFPKVISGAIPRGGLIHEKRSEYSFTVANQGITSGLAGSDQMDQYSLAFELFDGSVVSESAVVLAGRWDIRDVADSKGINGARTEVFTDELPAVIVFDGSQGVSGTVSVTQDDVTQQPEFSTSSTENATGLKNFGTGAAGTAGVTNPTNAIDGNQDNGAGVPNGDTLSVTFNSAPGNFDDDDTVASTLWVIATGNFLFRAGSTGPTLGTLTGASKGQYRFTQSTARDFNQTVQAVGQSPTGGSVYDLYWEHDLSTTVTLTRTQDTEILVDITTDLPDLTTQIEPIRSVLWQPSDFQGLFGKVAGNPWRDGTKVGWVQPIVAQLADIQRWLLEDESPQYARYIDVESYNSADIRYGPGVGNLAVSGLSFVLQDQISWPQLEAQLGEQLMAHVYYGPRGHTLVPILLPEQYQELGGVQDFRLPGVPGSNASVSRGSPLMERGGLGNVVNNAKLLWQRDWLQTNQPESYQRTTFSQASGSVDVYGEKVEDPRLFYAFTTEGLGHETYMDAAALLYSNRDAFGVTRFTFETGHRAYPRTQGDIIRIVFAVDENVFRNVLCEVESLRNSPINGEHRIISCRTVAAPVKGLTFGEIWTDIFTQDADTWTDRITGVFDRWEQYWGT